MLSALFEMQLIFFIFASLLSPVATYKSLLNFFLPYSRTLTFQKTFFLFSSIDGPSKMMKNAFYFILKAFRSQDI